MPSARRLDHCRRPRNVGVLTPADEPAGRAVERSSECGDTLQMHVKLDATRAMIQGARFKAYGCSATIAAGSFATEWLAGRQVADVADLTEAVITDALDLSLEEAHAAALAVRVVRAAVTDGTEGAGR